MLANVASALVLVAMVTVTWAETGMSGNNDEDWSYTWYGDEAFLLTCNSSTISAAPGDTVRWKTPSDVMLPSGHSSDDYELRDGSGVTDFELFIKKITPEVSGVYTCEAYGSGETKPRARMILGVNIHEEKYREKFDKYRHNLIVAVIATAVFVVPLGTSCFVYHFQYTTPEQKARKQKRRAGLPYTQNGGDVPMTATEKGAYENPNFSTQL